MPDVGSSRRNRSLCVALAALALAALGAGCSDDDSSTDQTRAGTGTSTTPGTSNERSEGETSSSTTTVPRPVPVSKPAKSKGANECAGTTPDAVVKKYLSVVKRSKAPDTAAVRHSLAMQVKQLRKAQGGVVPAPVAAAVYAVGKPRAQRSGAYQGCLQSLVKSAGK